KLVTGVQTCALPISFGNLKDEVLILSIPPEPLSISANRTRKGISESVENFKLPLTLRQTAAATPLPPWSCWFCVASAAAACEFPPLADFVEDEQSDTLAP